MVSVLETIENMKHYALEYNVPIMQQSSIEYINRRIVSENIKNILEIGTAIGYSTINFALPNKDIKVTSIERDINRYSEAVKNVNEALMNDRINLILSDALEVNLTSKYDLIIIDASKGKNKDFFNKFKSNLNENGLIIIDNIKFHGLVGNSSVIDSKNLRKLVEKIEEFIEFLKVQSDFYIELVDIGDGLAVCKKK